MTLKGNREFVRWAKRATAGIDKSGAMVGIITGDEPARLEFALQIGHCLLENKPLYIVAPMGIKLSKALIRAATAIEYFDPKNEESFRVAAQKMFELSGKSVRH